MAAKRERRITIHAALACVLFGCLGPGMLGIPSGPAVVFMTTCGVMAAIGCAAMAVAKYRNAACWILLLATIWLLLVFYNGLPLLAPLFEHIPLHRGVLGLTSFLAVVFSAVVALLWEAEAAGRRHCSERTAGGGPCMLMPGHMGPHVTKKGVRFDAPAGVNACGARTSDGAIACVLESGHLGRHVTRAGIPFDDDGAARDAEGISATGPSCA